ncbi:MAG: Acetyl-coenzyme A carboxylase carboxyl transferase subunit alpha [Pseudomonas citronellolis]|nr:MAG: Acetyl-coenzyme A carboxylase carboxyl transferase subunit alpha [Pseudomonas citronellolis]
MLSAVAPEPAEVCAVICWITAMVWEICPAEDVCNCAASEMLWISSARFCDTPSISVRCEALRSPERLKSLNIVDKVIGEPLGGAHRDPAKMSASIRADLLEQLDMLGKLDNDTLLKRRYDRLMSYGL